MTLSPTVIGTQLCELFMVPGAHPPVVFDGGSKFKPQKSNYSVEYDRHHNSMCMII